MTAEAPHNPNEYVPTYDLMSLTPDQVEALSIELNRTYGYDSADALEIQKMLSAPVGAFTADIEALPKQGYQHARAVIGQLALSHDAPSRAIAAIGMANLLAVTERLFGVDLVEFDTLAEVLADLAADRCDYRDVHSCACDTVEELSQKVDDQSSRHGQGG